MGPKHLLGIGTPCWRAHTTNIRIATSVTKCAGGGPKYPAAREGLAPTIEAVVGEPAKRQPRRYC